MGIIDFFTKSSPDSKLTSAKCSGKYLGYELFNLCLCGETVEPYERQEIFFYEAKQCWLRMCRKCLLIKSPRETAAITATPEQLEATELSLVPQG